MSSDKIVFWWFSDNKATFGDASLEIKDEKIVITVYGGFWGGNGASVTITRDKIIIKSVDGEVHELPTPWSKER